MSIHLLSRRLANLLDRTLEFQLTILPYLNNIFVRRAMMIVKITSKRQVTFPARVLDALGVGPGDQIELKEGPEGFILFIPGLSQGQDRPW